MRYVCVRYVCVSVSEICVCVRVSVCVSVSEICECVCV